MSRLYPAISAARMALSRRSICTSLDGQRFSTLFCSRTLAVSRRQRRERRGRCWRSAPVPCSARNVGGTLDLSRSMALRPPPCQCLHSGCSLPIVGEVRPSTRAKRSLLCLGLTARLPHCLLANFAHDGGDGLVGLEV